MAAYHQAVSEGDGPALSLVELALSSMTVLYGGLLGVFGLGMLASSRGSDASAIAGLAVGAVAGLALFLHPIFLGNVAIAWTWWIPIGATLAFAVVASRPRAPQARPPR
ncbi:MAG: hypothetical protein O7G30_10545, partial [Proteobacteria bacterium]|nr:hypothetical protein [Pseudomonadota bacterium]